MAERVSTQRLRRAGILVASALAAWSCSTRPPEVVAEGAEGKRSPVAVERAAGTLDDELLQQLAVLATGKRGDALLGFAWETWRTDLARGVTTLEAYVDALLHHPAFAEAMATRIFVRLTPNTPASFSSTSFVPGGRRCSMIAPSTRSAISSTLAGVLRAFGEALRRGSAAGGAALG